MPFEKKAFDAGVDANEETDPKKFIEQLSGKLGQSLRKYSSESGTPDFELEKFAVNSVISATHTSQMNPDDQNDIINKIKKSGKDGDENVKQSDETPSDNSDQEMPEINENELVNEVSLNDHRVKEIISLYDNGDDEAKKKLTKLVSFGGKINREQFISDIQSDFDNSEINNLIAELENNGFLINEVNLFLDKPKKNNMFQDGSNDILNEEDNILSWEKIGLKNKSERTKIDGYIVDLSRKFDYFNKVTGVDMSIMVKNSGGSFTIKKIIGGYKTFNEAKKDVINQINKLDSGINEGVNEGVNDGVNKGAEKIAKALDDKFWENKGIGKQRQRELLDLIPQNLIDNPNTNGFYRVSDMDDAWVSKQRFKVKETIKNLINIYKDKQKHDVIAQVYYSDKLSGKETELTRAVESLIGDVIGVDDTVSDALNEGVNNTKNKNVIVSVLRENFSKFVKKNMAPTIKPKIKKDVEKKPLRKNKPFLPKVQPGIQPEPKALNEHNVGFNIYHKTLASVVDEIKMYVINKGYDEIEYTLEDPQHVRYGTSIRIKKPLTKNGSKVNNVDLNAQIYRLDSGNYELNVYIA